MKLASILHRLTLVRIQRLCTNLLGDHIVVIMSGSDPEHLGSNPSLPANLYGSATVLANSPVLKTV